MSYKDSDVGSHVTAYERICSSYYALILYTFILMMHSINLINYQRGKWLKGHRQTVKYREGKSSVRSGLVRRWLLVTCVYSGVSGVMGVAQVKRGTPRNYRRAQGSNEGLQTGWLKKLFLFTSYVWVCMYVWVFWYYVYCTCIYCVLYCFFYVYLFFLCFCLNL
jgi:hypothetical protein